MEEEVCETCRFFNRDYSDQDEGTGERYPPVMIPWWASEDEFPEWSISKYAQPRTHCSASCGEYQHLAARPRKSGS